MSSLTPAVENKESPVNESSTKQITEEEASKEIDVKRKKWLESIREHNIKDGEFVNCKKLLEKLHKKNKYSEDLYDELLVLAEDRYKLLLTVYSNFTELAEFVTNIKDAQIKTLMQKYNITNVEEKAEEKQN